MFRPAVVATAIPMGAPGRVSGLLSQLAVNATPSTCAGPVLPVLARLPSCPELSPGGTIHTHFTHHVCFHFFKFWSVGSPISPSGENSEIFIYGEVGSPDLDLWTDIIYGGAL